MGIYINPSRTTKEDWLSAHGTEFRDQMFDPMRLREQNRVSICLIDNGPFTVAGVAFSRYEAMALAHPDGRPKKWYLVPIAALRDDTGISSRILEAI